MRKLHFIVIIVLSAYISACKPDLDINAPYTENMIVYALLNPDTATQYIRINKSFLGTENAYTSAQVKDSINYKPGELKVTLEHYLNGVVTAQDTALKDTLLLGQSGTFSTQQRVYKTNLPILQDDGSYRLTVKNRRTGKTVSSETKIVGQPSLNVPSILLYQKVLTGSPYYNYPMEITSSVNSKSYDFWLRFNYTEYVAGSDSSDKYFDFHLGERTVDATTGGSIISLIIQSEQFYDKVATSIVPNANITRRAKKCDILMKVGTGELDNYIRINGPTGSIVQEKPEYTNIKDGLGIFTSRLTYAYKGVTLSNKSIEWLHDNPKTSSLNFAAK